MSELDTAELLVTWWKWKNINTVDVGFNRQSSIAQLMRSTSRPSLIYNDVVMMLIDTSIARLNQKDPEMARATKLYARFGGNQSRIAREMKTNRGRSEVLSKAGIAWIDGILYANDIAI